MHNGVKMSFVSLVMTDRRLSSYNLGLNEHKILHELILCQIDSLIECLTPELSHLYALLKTLKDHRELQQCCCRYIMYIMYMCLELI